MARFVRRSVNRRRFLGYGGAAVAGAAALQAGVLALSSDDDGEDGRVPAFFLDPRGGVADALCLGDERSGSCISCNACQRHAVNRLYATQEVAESGRAHEHCNCSVRSFSVSRDEYVSLFGIGTRDVFDQRRDRMLGDTDVASVMQRTTSPA